jgi:starch phosphorylase
MYKIREFTVFPTVPERLRPLQTLASNLWWTWNSSAQELFERLDPGQWSAVNQNPVQLLNTVDQSRLEKAAADPAYLALLDRVLDSLRADQEAPNWCETHCPDLLNRTVAYFSAEFGLHECLPVYSGGLGVLAGDHLKASSDLGVPLVGVSLLYHYGYFHQHLSNEGWQFEDYPSIEHANMPIQLVTDDRGQAKKIQVELGEHSVAAQIWEVKVGRVRLFLLDTFLPENSPHDREISGTLYGGDQEMRIRQEVLLGIGGIRALQAMGIEPAVCHMNEGHCAFLALERARQLIAHHGLSFPEAQEAVAATTLFTTHTPLPAGIDTFQPDLVRRYIGPMAGKLNLSVDEFLALGRIDPARREEPFSMAVLALRFAHGCNGVSKLHARVARSMWHQLWRDLPLNELPIRSITNGVHVRTWQAPEMTQLFDRCLGPDWARDPENRSVWDKVNNIPDRDLWEVHESLRGRLVEVTRQALQQQLRRRGMPPGDVLAAANVLDPKALTIGFARRFATYKRATLFLSDVDRLKRILLSEKRPVQVIISGKAHPRDEIGKEFIKRIVQFAGDPDIRQRVVFLEDYSMGIARVLVRGVDVWMNNPIKMLEASGTSGMKVVPNGGLNFSVLDGWWPEAYDGTNGWAIGDEHVYDNDAYRDKVEGTSLYQLLENEIVPEFYERDANGLPPRWLKRMKNSMRTCGLQFSAGRMVREYLRMLYAPAAARAAQFSSGRFALAKELAGWKESITRRWPQIRIDEVTTTGKDSVTVGSQYGVEARVFLGDIAPDDVAVEAYYGPVDGAAQIQEGTVSQLRKDGMGKEGLYRFVGSIPCTTTGRQGFAIRVVPNHPALAHRQALGLLKWA